MAREYYQGEIDIKNGGSFRNFDSSEIGHYVTPEMVESGDIRFIHPNRIAFKVALSTYNRRSIDVDLCKSLDKKDTIYPASKTIRMLARMFGNSKSINIWLDKEHNVIFASTSDGAHLVKTELYDSAEDLSPELLSDLANVINFDVKEWYLISSDYKVYYIRDKSGLSKLFTPFMLDWFDSKWPGLVVADDHENGTQISKLGFRTLLQMFIFSCKASVNTAEETFPPTAPFTIAIPEMVDSSIGGAIRLNNKQVKQLSHMLPGKTVPVEKKDTPAFDDGMITDLKDESESFSEHEDVTWAVFASQMEKFPVGCTIYLAPNQIIMDSDVREVFSDSDVHSIIYHGPDFILPDQRNTIDIQCRGDKIENELRVRMLEYFDKEFDISVKTMRAGDKVVNLLNDKDDGGES